MKDELLERFRKDNFNSLTREEKEKLVIETIKAIQHEQGLSQLDIKFGGKIFGYDRIHNSILIDLQEYSDSDSYWILTGIIHEVRHQYQYEKLGMRDMAYSKKVYILDPKEIDAYEYTISEMSKYTDFFNKDDFDIYVLKLKNQFVSRKNHAINNLKRLGYEDEEIETIAKKIDKYDEESALISIEDQESGKDDVPEKSFKFGGGMPAKYKLYFNNNMSIMFPGLHMNIIGSDIYIKHMNMGNSLNVKDFAYLLQAMIDDLKEVEEIGLDINVENVHFPPVIQGIGGIPKDKYEAFLAGLGCKDKTISVNDLSSLDINENYTYKRTIPIFPDGMQMEFGMNYRNEYTEEQLKVLDAVSEFRLDLDDMMEEDESNNIKSFVACCQYRPDYSAKKMRLILEGQKRGLNTLHYEELDETQIEQLMALQLDGVERKDWIDIVKSGKSIEKAREELESVSEDELQQLMVNNDQTIEANNVTTKNALIERVLAQQETIAEQQTEMNRLNTQKKEL